MIANWYTIVFQAINFMILVFLLRRFLYGPIIEAMDERERKIVQREETAASRETEAEEARRTFRQRTAEMEARAEEFTQEARADAAEKKRALLEDARREVETSRRRWQEALEEEKADFLRQLRVGIGRGATSVARRSLADLADAELEVQIRRHFLSRLHDLPGEERLSLAAAMDEDEGRVQLRAAFEVPDRWIGQLEETLRATLGEPDRSIEVHRRVDPGLVCGIELETGGHRVAWAIDSYIGEIEEELIREVEGWVEPDSDEEENDHDAK